MPEEGKSNWGRVQAVSILIALALHAMALYVVAGLLNQPALETRPLAVVVYLQKTAPARDPVVVASNARQASGAQQAVTHPSSHPKTRHKAPPLKSWKEVRSSETTSPAPSMTSPPVAGIPIVSKAAESESLPSSQDLSMGVAVGPDLAFFCPVRPAPVYPRTSRKLGEEGTVILNVEWNQEGKITLASVKKSSGFSRLDHAALTAIEKWRCNPAERDGVPVRAVGVQPFSFQLQDDLHP